MKNVLLAFIIGCLISMSWMSINAYDDKLENLYVTNNVVKTDDDFEMDFTIPYLDYFIFKYSDKSETKWYNDNVIGPGDFEIDCLYSKNLSNGVVKKLVNSKIGVYLEKEDFIYFVLDNSVYTVDFEGERINKVLSSENKINNSILEEYFGKLYYISDEKLMRYDLTSKKEEVLLGDFDASGLCAKNDNEFAYIRDGIAHYVNVSDGVDREFNSEQEINDMFVEHIIGSTDIAPLAVGGQIDTNLNVVDSTYPAGSYFTNSGNPCNHHNSGCSYNGSCGCKQYDYCIQCAGFAKWAANKYANLSTWSPITGDANDTDTEIRQPSQITAYFGALTKGAYLRISKSSNIDNGFHSILFVKLYTNSVYSYDCNTDNHCGVSHENRSFDTIRTFSPYSSYYVSHHYGSNKVYYNSTYHKQYCSSSGCNGYRLEAHYNFLSTGSNKLCMGCGAYTNVQYTSEIID